MNYPNKVKMLARKGSKPLYESGLRKNKIYKALMDDEIVIEIFEEFGVVTVINDLGEGHEIEKGDYEIIELGGNQ